MNIDITNYGGDRYRLTSHGGRSFDLYNRLSGAVHTITEDEYRYIRGHDHPIIACDLIDDKHSRNKGTL